MTPLIIPFQTKVSGLLVKVPSDNEMICSFSTEKYALIVSWMTNLGDNQDERYNDERLEAEIELPSGKLQLIGEITSLTDKQKEIVCEAWGWWKDYTSTYAEEEDKYYLKNSSESFASLLKSLEVYSENPLGKKPERRVAFMGAGHYTENQLEEIKQYNADLLHWNLAQERVGKWLLLVKKED